MSEEIDTPVDSGGDVAPTDVPVDGGGGEPSDPAARDPITPDVTDNPANDGFSIPDEYKEAGYAKNFKSQDDVWKALDNAQALIGKKTVGVPDWDNATDEEIQGYYDKVRPESSEGYDFFSEDFEGEKETYQAMFHEAGLSKKQAETLFNSYQADMKSKQAQAYSQEGLDTVLSEKLGDNYKEAYNESKPVLASNLSKESKEALNGLPNEFLGIFVEFANNVRNKYGIDDASKAGDTKPDGAHVVDKKAEHARLFNELKVMERNPNATPQMRKEITDQISKLYGAN